MAAIEEVLWNVFTFYTLTGNAKDPSRLNCAGLFRVCRDVLAFDGSRIEVALLKSDLDLIYTTEIKNNRTKCGLTPEKSDKLDFDGFLSSMLRVSLKCYPSCASKEASMQQMLMNNILPLASQRQSVSIDGLLIQPAIVALYAYYEEPLEILFKHYAATSDHRQKRTNLIKSTCKGVKHFGDQVQIIEESKIRNKIQDVISQSMGYPEFLRFATEFGFCSVLNLSTQDLGEIYLAVISFSNNYTGTLRQVDFPKFWELLVRSALVAFRGKPKLRPAEKLKALFLTMWRYMQHNAKESDGPGKTRGCRIFNEKFMVSWITDGYKDYGEPTKKKNRTGGGVNSYNSAAYGGDGVMLLSVTQQISSGIKPFSKGSAGSGSQSPTNRPTSAAASPSKLFKLSHSRMGGVNSASSSPKRSPTSKNKREGFSSSSAAAEAGIYASSEFSATDDHFRNSSGTSFFGADEVSGFEYHNAMDGDDDDDDHDHENGRMTPPFNDVNGAILNETSGFADTSAVNATGFFSAVGSPAAGELPPPSATSASVGDDDGDGHREDDAGDDAGIGAGADTAASADEYMTTKDLNNALKAVASTPTLSTAAAVFAFTAGDNDEISVSNEQDYQQSRLDELETANVELARELQRTYALLASALEQQNKLRASATAAARAGSKEKAVSSSSSPTASVAAAVVAVCPICNDKELTHAYVPCGHTSCEQCADKVLGAGSLLLIESNTSCSCPDCGESVEQKLRLRFPSRNYERS